MEEEANILSVVLCGCAPLELVCRMEEIWSTRRRKRLTGPVWRVNCTTKKG